MGRRFDDVIERVVAGHDVDGPDGSVGAAVASSSAATGTPEDPPRIFGPASKQEPEHPRRGRSPLLTLHNLILS